MEVDLSAFNNNWYKPGNIFKRIIWYYINLVFFKTGFFPFYGLKILLLKMFGANIGKNVYIKPCVNIKYPWLLKIGNNVWIGEDVHIDNLAKVTIENNICISQGALLLCGSHNYKKHSFDLIVKPILLEDGVWVCAKAIICGGVICHTHCIISAGSIITKNCEAHTIYMGNPAVNLKKREVN